MHYYAKFFVILSDSLFVTLDNMFSNTIFTLPVVPFWSIVSFLGGPLLQLKFKIMYYIDVQHLLDFALNLRIGLFWVMTQ
jgi:hypothetical protein